METSQFLLIIFAVFLIETFVESTTKLGSYNCIILFTKVYTMHTMQRMIFHGDITLLKITAVGSLEFWEFACYVT